MKQTEFWKSRTLETIRDNVSNQPKKYSVLDNYPGQFDPITQKRNNFIDALDEKGCGIIGFIGDPNKFTFDFNLMDVMNRISSEVERATSKYPKMNSAHEGFAVLLEEVDELWDHVKMKETKRDLEAMKTEAIQCAAMCVRFATECCSKKEFVQN